MAINLNPGADNYNGEVLEDFLTYTAQENETYKEGLIHIHAGIQKKYTLPGVSLKNIIQDRVPTPVSSKGDYQFTERYLEPNDFMIYFEFNPRDFEKYYKFAQPDGNLVFRTLDPKVQAVMLRLLIEGKEEYINQAIWESATAETAAKLTATAGDVEIGSTTDMGPMKYFNGALTRMLVNAAAKDDTDEGKTGKVVLTGNTTFADGAAVETELFNMWKKIPKPIRKKASLKVLMDYTTWDAYDQYLSNHDTKYTDNREENQRMFRGKRIVPMAALPENTIIIGNFTTGMDSNLWMGVDYANDANVIKIAPLQNNSELYFFKALLKMDVNIVRPSEIVAHIPYTLATA